MTTAPPTPFYPLSRRRERDGVRVGDSEQYIVPARSETIAAVNSPPSPLAPLPQAGKGNRSAVLSFASLLATLFFTTFGHAAAERLDDSMSPRSSVEPTVTTTNGSVIDGAMPTEAALQFGWVEYRLNTAKYVGKSARIYYVVPAAIGNLRSPSGLRVEWRGRNTFASGSARAGQRVLLWSGVVTAPGMEDALELKMGLALSEMQGPIRFESYFEIEVN
jgi:hypothetical protein